MESKVDGDNAVFWVEVADDLSTNAVTIYIYYGKSDATTTSNGDNTFPFFDDFEDGVINTNKWVTSGTVTETGGYLQCGSGADSLARQNSANYPLVGPGYAIRQRALVSVVDSVYAYLGFSDETLTNYALCPNSYYSSITKNSVSYQYTDWGVGTAYAIYDILWTSAAVKYYCNGVLKATHTTYVPTVNMGAYQRAYTTTVYTRCDWILIRKYVDPEPAHGSWGSEETPAVAYTVTLTESLGLKDSVVKASSVVKRELLGLSDVYGRTWAAHRTYTEPLGLSDVVVKNVSVAKAESLGLSDVYARVWSIYRVYSELLGLKDTTAKSVSAFRAESLGLVDFYSRSWTAHRVFAEPLGLSDVVSSVRLYAQTLTELLGLSDFVAKVPSVVRAESLGLLDSYSRLWSVHRTYSENLGLADKVQKSPSTVKSELLGLSDVVRKSSSILKLELLGLSDFYS
jgi:hypothetical protein